MEILILAALLICPAVMGTAMLLMWRGMRQSQHGMSAEIPAEPQAEKSGAHPSGE